MADNAAPEHFRLFIAINIPEAIKSSIAAAQSILREAVPGKAISWTKPEQFHLTLKFLGNVQTPKVELLVETMRVACSSFPHLRLRAENLGAFPNLRRPRVLWVGLTDAGGDLPGLQSAIEQASAKFTGDKPEERFSGHVTLGRAKHLDRADLQALSDARSRIGEKFFGEWSAATVEVMRSQLSPAGARHTCVGVCPLASSG